MYKGGIIFTGDRMSRWNQSAVPGDKGVSGRRAAGWQPPSALPLPGCSGSRRHSVGAGYSFPLRGRCLSLVTRGDRSAASFVSGLWHVLAETQPFHGRGGRWQLQAVLIGWHLQSQGAVKRGKAGWHAEAALFDMCQNLPC